MRAIVLEGFGGVDRLRPAVVPDPEPGPGQLLVRVRATSANPFDVQQRRGDYREELALPAVIGSDVAGVVEEVGPGCTDYAPGDRVVALAPAFSGCGSYAELVAIDEGIAARTPEGISHEQAACLPVAGGTAWTCLVARGRVRPGETALIHAAAGGVGSFAVQIARAAGARVLATCSARGAETAAALGAETIVDYQREDVVARVLEETDGRGVDLVLDTVGEATIEESPRLLAPFGRVVTIVDIPTPQGLLAYWERNASLEFVFTPPGRHMLDELGALVERGVVVPLIEDVLPLARVGEAHARLEAGGVRGKLVLVP